ncbi:hypothetical protein BV908_12265 [Diaphorobacter sp. LR2014-1]|nr:hypothetical protein BV908_12265 [Diaphorobacter sp. LR2014-1]
MDGLVLSGNRSLVLSGNRPSCYQATKSAARPMLARVSGTYNINNLIPITGKSAAPRWITATRREAQQQQPGFPTRRARP